jgi:hypothetical protein
MVNPAEVTTSQEPLSDEEVVTRVLAGETAMFEIVMRRHNQRLYRVARAILRNEDVMQDALCARVRTSESVCWEGEIFHMVDTHCGARSFSATASRQPVSGVGTNVRTGGRPHG